MSAKEVNKPNQFEICTNRVSIIQALYFLYINSFSNIFVKKTDTGIAFCSHQFSAQQIRVAIEQITLPGQTEKYISKNIAN